MTVPTAEATVHSNASGTKHGFKFASVATVHINGYSYKLSIKFTEGPASMGNPSTLPPGWYVVNLPVSGSFTVTNTTAGRIAPDPISLANTDINALWKVPSPLCTQPNLDGTGPGIPPDAVHDVVGTTWYCDADTLVTVNDDTSGATLRRGKTVKYQLEADLCESTVTGNSCPTSPPTHTDSFVFTKPWVGKVLDTLRTKPPLVLAYWNADSHGTHTACTESSNSNNETVWVISSSVHIAVNSCS